MNAPADLRALVTVDLGAQSCRVSLLRWDLAAICAAADEGLQRCAKIATEGIATIGVTGWAVDYVRLDDAGQPIADPFCYRDTRTASAMEAVHSRISAKRLCGPRVWRPGSTSFTSCRLGPRPARWYGSAPCPGW